MDDTEKPDLAILFDLDGTLLPMDYDLFTKAYFTELAKTLAPMGYEAGDLVSAVWSGVKAILAGDAGTTNEQRFWKEFADIFGEGALAQKDTITAFYDNEFNNASRVTHRTPLARVIVDLAHEKAGKVILATNPIFPMNGVQARMNWAGLKPEDFDLVTSYESCHYCKPDPRYFTEIMEKEGLKPEQCLIIGNDVKEDILSAQSLGCRTYLITDCLIGRVGDTQSPSGTFEECIEYLRSL